MEPPAESRGNAEGWIVAPFTRAMVAGATVMLATGTSTQTRAESAWEAAVARTQTAPGWTPTTVPVADTVARMVSDTDHWASAPSIVCPEESFMTAVSWIVSRTSMDPVSGVTAMDATGRTGAVVSVQPTAKATAVTRMSRANDITTSYRRADAATSQGPGGDSCLGPKSKLGSPQMTRFAPPT